jgi:DGQHR domain-containing protein
MEIGEKLRYSTTNVTQGKYRFYAFTMPSDVLAKTCFVTTRIEDPQEGFQRVLDRKRAEEIAHYIDQGFGSIPNSIVLSAQKASEFQVIHRGKTVEFIFSPKSFLVLDGQHRIYGFSLAKTALRVPVVVYNNLSRQDETRLFIDINTKQRPVPNELLLDIKKLAEYETDTEQKLREVFDLFNTAEDSALLGLMSPAKRDASKISRVTFNAALKPIINSLRESNSEQVYRAINPYLEAFLYGMSSSDSDTDITNSTLFRAIIMLFPEVAQRVKDRHGPDYILDNFAEIIEPMLSNLKSTTIANAGNSHKDLKESFSKALKTEFSL